MRVMGLQSAAGNGFSVCEGEMTEVSDEIALDLVRAGHARLAPVSDHIQTMQLHQPAMGAKQTRRHRKEFQK